MEPEILVTVQFRLSSMETMDKKSLAKRMTPLMTKAIELGGDKVNVSLQPYNPDELVD